MPQSILVITLGKKSDTYDVLLERYRKLLRPYAQFSISYLRSPSSQKLAEGRGLSKSEKKMKSLWPKKAYSIALSENGKELDSKAFANWLGKRESPNTPLVFNIGGAYGFSADMKSACSESIRLSSMTFSHDLTLLILTEQLYRAFTILNGHPYHKD